MKGARGGAASLVLASALLAACAPEVDEQSVEFRVPVSVEEVGVATVEDRIVTTGTLRTPELVTLNALDAGVLEINRGAAGRRLAEGDVVEAGDEIARIVGEDVRIARRARRLRPPPRARRRRAQATPAVCGSTMTSLSRMSARVSWTSVTPMSLESFL